MNFFSLFRTFTINDVEASYKSENAFANPMETRRKVPICVIDDELFFQMEQLQSHGFDIVQVGNINSLNSIEKYEIVACDLRGVGSKFNEKLQGASIIQEIKRYRPEKYVIAYSGVFDRSNMARIAHELADRKLNKADDTDKWVRTLDEAIQIITNPVERWKRIRANLNSKGISTEIVLRLEKAYCKSVIKRDNKYLVKATKSETVTDEIKPIIQGLVSSAIWAGITYSG